MKKLIEVFNWKHEGEYDQYFFVVEDEKKFIEEMKYYLDNEVTRSDFPWSDPLGNYKEEQQIEPYFLIGDIPHLKETYYINFDYDNKFSLSKRSLEYKTEELK